MAVKIEGKEKQQQLLLWLETQLPQSFKIYQELKWNLKKDRQNELEVYVDRWPNPQVAGCIVDQVHSQLPSKVFMENGFVGLHGTTEQAISTFLNSCNFIDWNKPVMFHGVADCVWSVVRSMSLATEEFPVDLYRATCKGTKPLPIPAGMKLEPVTDAALDVVNFTWKHSLKESELMVKDLVHTQPSCMLTTEDGQPVGNMLCYNGGIMGMLYVFPQFRRRGYAKVLVSNLAQRIFEQGEDAFVFIEKLNPVSAAVHTSVGFTKVPGLSVVGWILSKPFADQVSTISFSMT